MNRFASSRSRTSSFDSDDGCSILKNWFVIKSTKSPAKAFGRMSEWGRSTPSGKDFTEYLWLATQFVRYLPSLLLNPTDTNAMFERLHDEKIIELESPYRVEAKRWSGVLRKGLSKYRECAKYESKTQTALRRCTDKEADDLLRFFYLVDTAETPQKASSLDDDMLCVHEQAEAVHATAADFQALLAVPADLLPTVPSAYAADFEALLSDLSDVSPARSSHMLQLGDWTWRDMDDEVDVAVRRVAISRGNILPLPSAPGAISRALPKAKKAKGRKNKPKSMKTSAKAKAKPVKTSAKAKAKPVKTSAKPVKTSAKAVKVKTAAKPVKTSAKPEKTLSQSRHCVVCRAYKRARTQACWVIMWMPSCSETGNDVLLFGNDMFLFRNDMSLFGNDMCILGNDMFLLWTDMFLFGDDMFFRT